MTKTVHVKARDYGIVLLHRKEKIEGKLRRKDEESAKSEKIGQYLIHIEIRIKFNEMGRAAEAKSEGARQKVLRLGRLNLLKIAGHKYFWYFCKR